MNTTTDEKNVNNLKSPKNYALISVWDKEGINSVARALNQMGHSLLATGGTKDFLVKEGFDVTDVSELTGEPERFGGRLKTLHHKILGGILPRPDTEADLAEWPYDFRIGAVVCNFYPFQQKASEMKTLSAVTEWIDIGGPTMVRSAAKNYEHVWVFTHPDQYTRFIASPERNRGLRERFAAEAFGRITEYDKSISLELDRKLWHSEIAPLRYGENPHQKARFFPHRQVAAKYLGEWSYNNIRDAEAALRFIKVFSSSQAAVSVVKHQTLCGAAVAFDAASSVSSSDVNSAVNSETIRDAVFDWAWEADARSRFGGVLAFNHFPSAKVRDVLGTKFIEVLALPRSSEAEEWSANLLREKPDHKMKLRIVLVDTRLWAETEKPFRVAQAKSQEAVEGLLGRLEQDPDSLEDLLSEKEAKDAGKIAGTQRAQESKDAQGNEQILLDRMGTWASACSKSNAMLLCGWDAKNRVAFLAGAGQGQPNRVDALDLLAAPRAREFMGRKKLSLEILSCYSDAFLPFDDVLHSLKKWGIRRLIQPGGSKADSNVQSTANKLGIEMHMTGRRHFWH